MEDSPPLLRPDSTPAPAAPPPPRLFRGILIFVSCIAIFGVTSYIAMIVQARSAYTIKLPVSILIVVAVILAGCGAAIRVFQRQRNQWTIPTDQLRATLEEILDAKAPIDHLPASAGGLTPLLPVLRELLRDLRRKRADVARLNFEMKQRVAQRTDALERRLGSLQAQATRDPLTGLYNRRMLDECIADIIRRAVDAGAPLCVLMIDVDDFKLLNDTLGHGMGDELLRAIAQLIRSGIRQDDLAFRCGGDEFVVLLPGTGRIDADNLARRLTDLVDALCKTINMPRKPRLSIGVSSLSDCIGPPQVKDLMEAADRHLYTVKNARKSARQGIRASA